jgi:hypothetical protein
MPGRVAVLARLIPLAKPAPAALPGKPAPAEPRGRYLTTRR